MSQRASHQSKCLTQEKNAAQIIQTLFGLKGPTPRCLFSVVVFPPRHDIFRVLIMTSLGTGVEKYILLQNSTFVVIRQSITSVTFINTTSFIFVQVSKKKKPKHACKRKRTIRFALKSTLYAWSHHHTGLYKDEKCNLYLLDCKNTSYL